MTPILLAAWVALLGADRIDLGGGNLPFAVTPFLVLTPLLALAQAAQRLMAGRGLEVSREGRQYTALLLGFLCVIGASVFVSFDAETSIARATLVVVQALGTLLIAVHVHRDPGALRMMRRGATAGIILFTVFNVLALASFLGAVPEELPFGFAVLKLQSFGYAGIVPRLSGQVLDPNRGGLLLVFFAVLSPRLRGPAAMLLVLTLSRSAALAALGVIAVGMLEGGVATRAAPRRAMLVALVVVAVGLAMIGRSPAALESTQRAIDPFSERLSLSGEGSAAVHTSLLARAGEEGTRSAGRAMLGLGWGASYTVLQDIFPGNRYGNFHSLYATTFVEAGVFAMLLIMTLLAVPILRDGPWRATVAGTALFSIFYQATADPVFWFILAMGWMTLEPSATRESSRMDATT